MQIIADQIRLKADPLAELLISKIQELQISDAIVYYNFPLFRGETKDEVVKAHILFVSKEYGVIFFRCIENLNLFSSQEESNLDELDGHIFAKINKYDDLRKGRRELKINVSPYVFVNDHDVSENGDFIGPGNIKDCIKKNVKEVLDDKEYNLLVAVIEGTVNIKHKKDRDIKATSELKTKGAILTYIQNHQAVYDIEQKRAALNIIDSPQRIRGLAGSGKTIILAMKAALYHLEHSEEEILYTYFTKALYGQVKYLIEKFYRDFSENKEPDWNKIHIWHGWGGKGLRGVYSDTCMANNVDAISFPEAISKSSKNPFAYVCGQLEKKELKKKFDLTLIDEGQDFPKEFYQLCRKITKDNRIVWAYDDFQNIFDVEMQDEKETFGKDTNGEYYVDFERNENILQDIVLQKCYRNPRYVLLNSFSLGLGIYNDKVLQRLESNQHWTDLGFTVESGDSKDGSKMVISRPNENSPIETNKQFDNDSVAFHTFESLREECEFIANSIIDDINIQELRPDDISVICLDSKNIAIYFEVIELLLSQSKIQSFNLLNAHHNNTYYSVENHVTLSTINKAKGNESGMVYIIGVDAIFANKDSSTERNKLFTAMTRSKGWLVMTGMKSDHINLCSKEMDLLRSKNYKFEFIQPSKKETRTIAYSMDKRQSDLNDLQNKLSELSKSSGLSKEELINLLNSQIKVKK